MQYPRPVWPSISKAHMVCWPSVRVSRSNWGPVVFTALSSRLFGIHTLRTFCTCRMTGPSTCNENSVNYIFQTYIHTHTQMSLSLFQVIQCFLQKRWAMHSILRFSFFSIFLVVSLSWFTDCWIMFIDRTLFLPISAGVAIYFQQVWFLLYLLFTCHCIKVWHVIPY